MNESRIADAAADNLEARMIADARQILEPPGRFVVHHRHAVSAREQGFGQMGADKTRSAGDKDLFHSFAKQ